MVIYMNVEDIEVEKKFKIVFMGTPEFSVPVLKGLIDDKADSSDLTNINTSITKITTQMINKTDLTTETWRFTLEDNTTVDKKVALWS